MRLNPEKTGARRIVGSATIGALLLLGPTAAVAADEECEPYVKICETTTTTDRDRNTTTSTTSTTMPETSSTTFTGGPGGPVETTTTTTQPEVPPSTFPPSEPGIPVTGGDVLGMAAFGAAAMGIGTILVRRSRQA